MFKGVWLVFFLTLGTQVLPAYSTHTIAATQPTKKCVKCAKYCCVCTTICCFCCSSAIYFSNGQKIKANKKDNYIDTIPEKKGMQ